jgi:DNA-binding IclR family transcriptional regulator
LMTDSEGKALEDRAPALVRPQHRPFEETRLAILGSVSRSEGKAVEKSRRGIQSVEIASSLLLALGRHVKPMALKDVAQAAGISANKAHPYMVTFLKVGFVEQDGASGHYELGPLALQLGLAKLQRLDPVKEAAPHIADLAEQTDVSIAVAVWGNLGPTIVRLEEPTHPLHVNLRTGTVMSLMNTATGRLFAAFMPPKVIEKAMQGEVARMGHAVGTSPLSKAEFDRLVSETRRHGLSRSLSQPIPGIDAFCAPVFDSAGKIVLGLLAMGPSATFDSAWDGKVASSLRRCADEVSRKLGYESKLEVA